jgi:hypothetical protein
MDAMAPQGESLLHTFHRVVLGTISTSRATLTLVLAETRRRMGAPLSNPPSAMFPRASTRKTVLALAGAGIAGLALIVVLLEISVRNELARGTIDAAISIPAPSASPNQADSGHALPVPPASVTAMEPAEPRGGLGSTTSSDRAQSLGQTSGERVPLPRSRKPR